MEKNSKKTPPVLWMSWINTHTPLELMIAVSDSDNLYLLEFSDAPNLSNDIDRLKSQLNATVEPGRSMITYEIEAQLKAYFEGRLKKFYVYINPILGTPFQQLVWEQLINIPYGQTQSYREQAAALSKPSAYRAVANANGANPLAIIIPCHRVINHNGKLGGYSSGIERKQWLLNHEKKNIKL